MDPSRRRRRPVAQESEESWGWSVPEEVADLEGEERVLKSSSGSDVETDGEHEFSDTLSELGSEMGDDLPSRRRQQLQNNLESLRKMVGKQQHGNKGASLDQAGIAHISSSGVSIHGSKSLARIFSAATESSTAVGSEYFSSGEIAAKARAKRAHLTAVAFKEYARELENKLEVSNAHAFLLSERVQTLEFHRLLLGLACTFAMPLATILSVFHIINLHQLGQEVILGCAILWGLVLGWLLVVLVRQLMQVRRDLSGKETSDVRRLKAVAEQVAKRAVERKWSSDYETTKSKGSSGNRQNSAEEEELMEEEDDVVADVVAAHFDNKLLLEEANAIRKRRTTSKLSV